MNRICSAFVLTGLLLTSARAELPADLAAAAHAYERAQINGERTVLDRLVADEYVLIGGDGSRQNKANLIVNFTTPDVSFNPVVLRDVIEHVWTDGAALGATVDLSGSSNGEPFSQTLRYVDIWKRTEDGWRVVYGQVTRVSEPE